MPMGSLASAHAGSGHRTRDPLKQSAPSLFVWTAAIQPASSWQRQLHGKVHVLTPGLLGYSSMPSWYEFPRARRAGPAWAQMNQVHASHAACLMAHQAQRLIDKHDAPRAPAYHPPSSDIVSRASK